MQCAYTPTLPFWKIKPDIVQCLSFLVACAIPPVMLVCCLAILTSSCLNPENWTHIKLPWNLKKKTDCLKGKFSFFMFSQILHSQKLSCLEKMEAEFDVSTTAFWMTVTADLM